MIAKLRRGLERGTLPPDQLFPWSRMTGYRRICEVMSAAGIRGSYATPKGLRHAFGVHAVQSGVPLNMVQRWLGHADIKTTAIYTNATGLEERNIAMRMWHDGGYRAHAGYEWPEPGSWPTRGLPVESTSAVLPAFPQAHVI